MQKHGINFEDAQRLWENKVVQLKVTELPEERYLNLGVIDGKYWTAVITYREANVRIISVRRSAKKRQSIMKMLSSNEFDQRFDAGENIEEFVDWSQKPVIIEPLNNEKNVKSFFVKVDNEVYKKAAIVSNLMHLEKDKVLTSALSLGLAKMEAMVTD